MSSAFLDHVVRDRDWLHRILVSETFFLIRCESSIVRKCSTQFLDSNQEDIGNIVLLVLSRTNRMTPHYPIRGSYPSNFRWMDCRRYSAASRLEVLLDEDDFRSFSQALELEDVLQLSVTVLSLWNQCCVPPSDPPWRVSPHLFDHFQHVGVSKTQRSVDSDPHTGLSVIVESVTASCFSWLSVSWSNSVRFSISFVDPCPRTGLRVLDIWVLGFGWIRWVSLLLSATSESRLHVHFGEEIAGGGRGHTYTFWFLISSDFIKIAFETQWISWECIVEDDLAW